MNYDLQREEIQRLADIINKQEPSFLQATTKGYICPVCGQGAHKGNGITRTTGKQDTWFCINCRLPRSITGLFANANGIPDDEQHYPEIVRAAAAYYGITTINGEYSVKQQPKKEGETVKRPPQQEITDYSKYYKKWNTLLLQADEGKAGRDYLHSRGITDETMKDFNIGFDPEYRQPGTREFTKRPCVIFPRNQACYQVRDIRPKEQITDDFSLGRIKQTVGRTDIFNAAAFEQAEAEAEQGRPPIIVVEGEIDTLSIIQTGYKWAIGISGTSSGRGKLLEHIKQHTKLSYILALDNDDAGRTGQKAIAEELDKIGVSYIAADAERLYLGCKDANDAYRQDKAKLTEQIVKYADDAYNKGQEQQAEEAAEAYKRTGAGMVDTFLLRVSGDRYKPISTGYKSIDKALNGGFERQTLVMIGGAPSIGKTAIVSQLAEKMAASGYDVLYLNLEMSREQLLARSFARIANDIAEVKDASWITETAIRRGYEWAGDPVKVADIKAVADYYKAHIADHIIYNPDAADGADDPHNLDAIIKTMTAEIKRLGHCPPVIIIDYLQLITVMQNGRAADPAETIRQTVSRLKDFAIQNDCTVICITATNRAANKTGDADLNSGRDTSNIEYSADCHIGLVYTAIENGEKWEEATGRPLEEGQKSEKITLDDIRAYRRRYYDNQTDQSIKNWYDYLCKRITLKVNKNRSGYQGAHADLIFDGEQSRFYEIEKRNDPPEKKAEPAVINLRSKRK